MNKAQYELAVRLLGIPATITHVKTSVAVSVPKVGIANARKVGDAAIVNEYGINARIVTVLASDISFELEKFDMVVIAGEKLVLDAAIAVHEPGTGVDIGWRGFIRGK